ncbi:tRNA:m(4)X modification enzyme TRM13 homolog [Anthonomus grandis grandis]|uniref:tRNA:m(4)X modification enzyme TRM13 homolog n=1 Tax=Anthonomus grandis grandis TaxID=2921223 RepID=UPI0021668A31|nr:tRNA:m(4)X modification enzyme TRM13 homolog [Anthonomus grandis grandis]
MSDKSQQQQCKFFVQRKKRYCKMLVKPNQQFCGEHQKPLDPTDADESNTSSIRIACPLDGKHTVYAHNLQKHLKICNARPGEVEPYIIKDINSGNSEVPIELASTDTYQMLYTFSKDQIATVIDKVSKLYEHISVTEKMPQFTIVEEEMKKPEYGPKTIKHLKQASAIVGMLEHYDMLKDDSCFIEFGAGRGQLSCWVAEATNNKKNCKILLVERASPKHKRDNKLARVSDRIQRIRADIAHLSLDKYDFPKDTKHIIGITKHLCGEATDLAIRCLANSESNKKKIGGAVFTFCCHHRCRWTPYTGKQFFEENNLGITEFNIMCGLSSWATCGTGFSREYREELKIQPNKQIKLDLNDYGLSREEREDIGRKCKNVINYGRLLFLEQFGLKCQLHFYVEKDVTLENVCIVAYKR